MKPIADLLALLLAMGQSSAQAGPGDGADAPPPTGKQP